MPLIEAINILSKFFIDDHEWAISTGDNSCISGEEIGKRVKEAIDTLIEYAENESIPKEKLRNLDVIDISGFECVAVEDIKELLGE